MLRSHLRIALSALVLLSTITTLRAESALAPSAAGELQFNKCMACHSLQKGTNLMGPSLSGLAGRKAGSMPGFTYSPAMSASKVTWNRDTLSSFLEKPMQYIPGNTMPFAGLRNADQRAALIDFLLNDGKLTKGAP